MSCRTWENLWITPHTFPVFFLIIYIVFLTLVSHPCLLSSINHHFLFLFYSNHNFNLMEANYFPFCLLLLNKWFVWLEGESHRWPYFTISHLCLFVKITINTILTSQVTFLYLTTTLLFQIMSKDGAADNFK